MLGLWRACLFGLVVACLAFPAAGAMRSIPDGSGYTEFKGVVGPHAGCADVALPPGLGGQPFQLLGPRETLSDYVIVWSHSTGGGIERDAALKNVRVNDRTVWDEVRGGGGSTIIAPTREIGTIPLDVTSARICMRDTVDSVNRYYAFRAQSNATSNERFQLHVGGTLPRIVTLVNADVTPAVDPEPVTVSPFSSSATSRGPRDLGLTVVRKMAGYETVRFAYAVPGGGKSYMVHICEDRNMDGNCGGGPTEPVRSACLKTDPLHPERMRYATSEAAMDLMVAVRASPNGCDHEITDIHLHPHGAAPDTVAGQIWYTQCDLPPGTHQSECTVLAPGDPV